MDIVLLKFKNILNPEQFEKLMQTINSIDCDISVKVKNLQSLYVLLSQDYFKFNNCLKIFEKNCKDSNSDFLNKAYCYVIAKRTKEMLKR